MKQKAIQCDPDRRVHLSFKRVTNDFNMTGWHIFAQFSLLRSSVVYYDHQQKAVHPVLHELPWPITWILSRFNRKHIWCNQRHPNLTSTAQSMQQFCEKMKWSWWFRNDPPMSVSSIRIPWCPTPRCPYQIDPALMAWLRRLTTIVQSEATRGCQRAACRGNISNRQKQ